MLIEVALAVACVVFVAVVTRKGRKRKRKLSSNTIHPLDDAKHSNVSFLTAKEHYRNENFKDALHNIDDAIELQSECKSCLWLRAKIFIALKQYQEAILDCNEILELDDCYSWAYATRGDAYLLLEQYNNALENLEQALILKPDMSEAQISRIKVYFALGEYETADSIIRKFLEQNPNNYSFLLSIVPISYQLKRYERVVTDVIKLTSHRQFDVLTANAKSALYYHLVWSYDNLEKYDEALEVCKKIEKLIPNQLSLLHLRAKILYKQARFEDAKTNYKQALDIFPNEPSLLYEYTKLLWETQNYEEGLIIADRLVKLSENGNYYQLRALHRLGLHQFKKSIQDLTKAMQLTIEEDASSLYNNRSIALQKLKNYKEARQDIVKSLELNPKSVYAHLNYAQLYLHDYEIEKAIELCKKAIKIEPQNAFIYLKFAICFILLQKYELAYTSVEEAQNFIEHHSWEVDTTYALLEYVRGNVEEALKHWNEAVKKLPKHKDWKWVEDEYEFPQSLMAKLKNIFDEFQTAD